MMLMALLVFPRWGSCVEFLVPRTQGTQHLIIRTTTSEIIVADNPTDVELSADPKANVTAVNKRVV